LIRWLALGRHWLQQNSEATKQLGTIVIRLLF
jgi:hypothetical protein